MVRDESGIARSVVGVAVDHTERKRLEAELFSSQQLQTAILDSLPQHIAVLDRAGEVVAVNSAWKRFALGNGIAEPKRVGVGANCLDVLRRAAQQHDVADTRTALRGIERVR